MTALLTAEQIRAWDAYTIAHEPISSVELMERAASACTNWLCNAYAANATVSIFCGTGNNGGDGLVIARQLAQAGYQLKVFIAEGQTRSADFSINLKRLEATAVPFTFLQADHLPEIEKSTLVVDALFGSGLNKPLDGLFGKLVEHINRSAAEVVAIDMPSGLFCDQIIQQQQAIICATHTLTFQVPKYSFLFAENEKYVGNFHVLGIGLHPGYLKSVETNRVYVDVEWMKGAIQTRKHFAHKGAFGHALLVAGSKGYVGAALLAARACLRSGVGLLTVHVPAAAVQVMHTALPEAMVRADKNADRFTGLDTERMPLFNALGMGPGLGTHPETSSALADLVERMPVPTVLDADALNIISGLWKSGTDFKISGKVITPHPKEFDRLAGTSQNSGERMQKLESFVKEKNTTVVLKGAHTCVHGADGKFYFNSSGNPGLAKGGSGDVLTGIILALLAQGYDQVKAAVAGVYLHGLAADIALKSNSEESLLASDVIEALPQAFRAMEYHNHTQI